MRDSRGLGISHTAILCLYCASISLKRLKISACLRYSSVSGVGIACKYLEIRAIAAGAYILPLMIADTYPRVRRSYLASLDTVMDFLAILDLVSDAHFAVLVSIVLPSISVYNTCSAQCAVRCTVRCIAHVLYTHI